MLDQIKVLITGDGAKLTSALNTASGQIAAFGSKAQMQFRGLAAAIGALGIGAAIKKTVSAYGELYEAAQRAGVAASTLSKLQYWGKLAGISVEDLDTGLRFLNKNLAAARNGNEELAKLFARLGVDINQGVEPAVASLAEAFGKMGDGSERVDVALKLLGKSGATWIPALSEGSAALKTAYDEAERFGKVVKDDAAKAADELSDNLTKLGGALAGPLNTALQDILPVVAEFSTKLLNLAQAAGGLFALFENKGKKLGLETAIAATNWEMEQLRASIDFVNAQTKKGYLEKTPERDVEMEAAKQRLISLNQQLIEQEARLAELNKKPDITNLFVAAQIDPNAPQTVAAGATAAVQAAQPTVPTLLVPMAVVPAPGGMGPGKPINSYDALWEEFQRQQGMATGGAISGPGTSTSDSILARLSTGEYVVRASAVRAYGRGLLDAINAKRFNVGGMVGAPPRYAGGGEVSFAIDFGGRRAGVARTSSTEADMISRMARRAAIQRAPR